MHVFLDENDIRVLLGKIICTFYASFFFLCLRFYAHFTRQKLYSHLSWVAPDFDRCCDDVPYFIILQFAKKNEKVSSKIVTKYLHENIDAVPPKMDISLSVHFSQNGYLFLFTL